MKPTVEFHHTVTTPYGDVRLECQTGSQLYLHSDHLLVNRVDVKATLHLLFDEQSKLFVPHANTGYVTVHKRGDWSWKPSRSVMEKVQKAFVDAANAWASDNGYVLATAEYLHLKRRLDSREAALDEAHSTVRTIRAEVEALKAQVSRYELENIGGVL